VNSLGTPVSNYYVIYYSVRSPNIEFGIVCESTYWCGFGISFDGNMFFSNGSGTYPSDVVLGYIDSTGNGVANDFDIMGRFTPANCATIPSVCTDVATTSLTCTDNLSGVSGYRNGSYVVLEYTRPLTKSDPCDLEIFPGVGNYIIYSLGTGNGVWPTSINKHIARAKGGVNVDFVIFQSPLTTGIATTQAAATPTTQAATPTTQAGLTTQIGITSGSTTSEVTSSAMPITSMELTSNSPTSTSTTSTSTSTSTSSSPTSTSTTHSKSESSASQIVLSMIIVIACILVV